MQKRKMIVGEIATLIVLSILLSAGVTGELEITQVSQSSDVAQPNADFTVTLEFSDASDVELVKLLLCQLEPEFYCESNPILMEKTSENVYSATFVVPFENGSVMGYHIQIVYTNGSDVMIPNAPDFLGMSNIVEPIQGEFYFKVPVLVSNENGNTETSPFIVPFGAFILLITSHKLLKRKRDN